MDEQYESLDLIKQKIVNMYPDFNEIEFPDINNINSINYELIKWNKILERLFKLDDLISKISCKFPRQTIILETHWLIRNIIMDISDIISKAISRLCFLRGNF
jgi:hypothetical protein